MTPIQFAKKHDFSIVNFGDGTQREIQDVYCGDLLSVVMSHAKANDAWITVMGNINSVAVCVLTDVSCIILSEGMSLDNEALFKAQAQDICILKSELSTYEIAVLLFQELSKSI